MDCLDSACKFVSNFLPYQIYRVDEATDIKDFAKKHKVSPQNCIYESSLLKVGDYVIIKTNFYKIYVVRPGESIEDIAKSNSTTVEKLKALNNINKLFVGQQLLI